MRDDGLVLMPNRRDELKKELGDVLWYVAAVAREAGLTLEEIAWHNYTKF